MNTFNAWNVHKLLSLSAIFFHLCMVVPCTALAQSLDVDGPTIVHANDEYSHTDTVHRFSLSATDASGVKSVLLFHRSAGTTEFAEANMAPVPGNPDRFELSIELDNTNSTIEYYIQAEDFAGNIILKGFAFDPLVRTIGSPINPIVAEQQTEGPATVTSRNRKLLYIALGVLGAGLIASLAGGSSSGGTTASDCSAESGCRLTVNVPVPQ